MTNLTDDHLFFEIIARLPLKYAVQCSLLNKNFHHWISHPSFIQKYGLLSSCNTTLFHCSGYTPNIFSRISTHVSRILPTQISILASCNGLLLLRFYFLHSYYVFNPVTGGIRFVDFPINGHDDIGLAVDFAGKNHHFKLVTIDVMRPGPMHQTVLRFSVIVPSASSMLLKFRADFDCVSFTLMPDENIRPVYAHGCLHWLGNRGQNIVVFDVEKEQARIINGPVKNNVPGFHDLVVNKWLVFADGSLARDLVVGKWFGFADGARQFVYNLREEIVTQSHDYLKNEWQVKHRTANICNPCNNDHRYGTPLFFDGRKLFVQLRKKGEDGEVRTHDVLNVQWEKFGNVYGWSDRKQLFFSYFPTLAKVSDKYLLRANASRWKRRKTKIKNSFRGLQQLLRYPN